MGNINIIFIQPNAYPLSHLRFFNGIAMDKGQTPYAFLVNLFISPAFSFPNGVSSHMGTEPANQISESNYGVANKQTHTPSN